jgi:peptidoglycan/LPS O-acetylase OafA/YrhL
MRIVLSEYTKTRNNNFNLIRFIASSLVLYTHSFAVVIGSGDAEPLRKSLGMTWGSIAVDIFFVTSGFLIASSFFGRSNILAFVWARILRIYPALVIAMIFCTFVVGLFFTTNTTSEYLYNLDIYKYFLKNTILFFGVEYHLPGVFSDIPYKNAINGSIWTLPYEVKMYAYLAMIGSIIVYFQKWLSSKFLKTSFLLIAVSAVAINITNHFQLFIPVISIHLFSMFFVGVAFYVCRDNIYLSSKMFVLLLIPLSLSIFHKEIFFIIYCITLPYLIFYIAYVPKGRIRKFNNAGDYSYGIYIYAFPVQQSIATLIPNSSIPFMITLSFFITFLLAFLSWHLIEKKVLKMKKFYIVFENFLQNAQLRKH